MKTKALAPFDCNFEMGYRFFSTIVKDIEIFFQSIHCLAWVQFLCVGVNTSITDTE